MPAKVRNDTKTVWRGETLTPIKTETVFRVFPTIQSSGGEHLPAETGQLGLSILKGAYPSTEILYG